MDNDSNQLIAMFWDVVGKTPNDEATLIDYACTLSFLLQNLGFNFDNNCVADLTLICSEADDIDQMVIRGFWSEGQFFKRHIVIYQEAIAEAKKLIEKKVD